MAQDSFNQLFHELGKIQATQKSQGIDISEIKKDVANYKKDKNKLIGACVALSAGVGGGFSAIVKAMGVHL